MARLPDKNALSGPVSLRSGRAIATYDATAIGRGISAAGNAIAGLGAQIRERNNALDIARAEAYKTKGLLDVQNEFDQDPDYATFGKRAPAKTGDVVKNAAGLIRDPYMREKWSLNAQNDAARYNDSIFDRGVTLGRQAEVVALDDALEVNRRLYVDPDTSDDVKKKARADIEGTLATAEATGLLTPEGANAFRKKYIEDADYSRGELAVQRDPNIISKPLPQNVAGRAGAAMAFYMGRGYTKEQAAGIVGNLIAESNLTPSGAVGDNGTAFGIAQWRGERLTRLKRFASASGKDWQDFETQLAFVDMELQNHETAAYRALKNAKTVDEATAAFIGYERPRGWTANNPRGGHNYGGRLKFAAQAAGQEVNPDWYQRLSPEQRQDIQSKAQTRSNQIAVETRGQIEVATTNAPAAILNTGQYDGILPTADQFMQAYGAEDGAKRFNAFSADVETSRQAFEFRTMSEDQIKAAISEAVPTSSGDNAALETERYETLTRAADATLKARAADPATYARQAFPSVDAAWANVQDEGGYRAAIAASIAAQQQLGIAEVKPLPKFAADAAVESYKDERIPTKERVESVLRVLVATDDNAQRRVLFEQLVDAGLPGEVEGAIDAYMRGDEGAAGRLFEAAMVDVSKLPGKIDATPADIDEAVQGELFEEGSVGDIYYGISDGSADNLLSAQRDNALLTKAVNIRMRRGEDLEAAVQGAAKDLFGDVQVVNESNAQIILPAGADADAVLSGLESILPDVRSAVTDALTLQGPVPVSDGTKAIMDATTANRVEDILATGYFRNAEGGYVYIDPYTGAAIPDASGKPMIFTLPTTAAPVDVNGNPVPVAPEAPGFSKTMRMENEARQKVFQ